MQLIATIGIVTLAAAVLLRALLQAFFKKKATCGGGCGKCATMPEPKNEGRFPLPQA